VALGMNSRFGYLKGDLQFGLVKLWLILALLSRLSFES
jgi:hypothetical protein